MKTCREFEALLSSYAKEELNVIQSGRVAAHIARCAHCRREVETYRRLAEQMRNLPAPILPEQALQEFSRAVSARIAQPRTASRSRAFALLSPSLPPQWRYGWVAVATLALVLVLGILYAPFERTGKPTALLAPLLQARAWDKLYYGLVQKETRKLLLHEPVPTELVKTALEDLLKKGERDRRIRAGLRQLFVAVAGRERALPEVSRSAKILGVVTMRGYRAAPQKPSREYDPAVLLEEVQKLPVGTEVTLADLIKPKD